MHELRRFFDCLGPEARGSKYGSNSGATSPSKFKEASTPWSEFIPDMLQYLTERIENLKDKDEFIFKREKYADGSKYEGFLLNG